MKNLDVQKAEMQIYEQRKTVRYDIRELTIEIIVNKYVKGLDYSPDLEKQEASQYYSSLWVPDYQRDFTWDEERQSRFIESVLLGLPIPLIFVAENKDSVWEIVDGSQRIRTLHAFLNDNLRLSHLEKLNTLNGFKFSNLDPSRRGKFNDLPIRMIVLTEEATDEVKKDMFERINRGSDLLKPMEKRKGIYPGYFNDFIYKRCAKNETFIELTPIDKWLQKRQELEELLLRYFALIHVYQTFPEKKGIARVLDEFLDNQNKLFDKMEADERETRLDEIYKDFCSVLDFVKKYSVYGFRNRHNPQTKRTVFEAIAVGVHLALKENPRLVISKEKMNTILQSEKFATLVLDHVANKWAYSPERVKERIEYVRDSLLN
ncbi:MAG: DUF262 domain-containing protein [Bacteroidales bacterium]|nr:DUF262 domain-containing protein [Bacteroidales bacterium]